VEQLDGKVAVITGAASGIGRALVRRLLAEGARVFAADVEAPALSVAVREVHELGDVTAVVADVRRFEEVDALAARAYAECGPVDVLCNNAGVFAGGLMWERPPSDFAWTMDVNLWGILHGIRAFVPRMLATGTEAHIVNTVSMAGLCTTPFSGPYTVSKFAALAATECLAHDLAAVGAPIKVSALVPGAVATRIATSHRNRPRDLAAARSGDAEFVEQALAETTARGACPDDVAALVVDAIRHDTFLVPTRPSYARQLHDRVGALAARRLPPVAVFD
jgi:NAD(P)-dependent dehydrogenase (short-subunit alcohol dehydrogenase family)